MRRQRGEWGDDMNVTEIQGGGSQGRHQGAMGAMGATAEVIAFRPKATAGLSSRDLMVLSGWHIEGHGMSIEAGRDGMPSFAAISADQASWAIWGIVRQGAVVLVWNCVTHADLGRFDSMEAALMALPLGGPTRPAPLPGRAKVILLRPSR